jgi:hypothetical protein
MKEILSHEEVCRRIGDSLPLYDFATIMEICKILYGTNPDVQYIGSDTYVWELKEDI